MVLLALMFMASTLLAAETNASPATCSPCHKAQTTSFAHADMTRALESIKECEILRSNPTLKATINGYSYEIKRVGDESLYSVTNGTDTITANLRWAFGLGAAGQTYLFERDGRWYESRVSYYSEIRGLDVTMGAQGATPANLDEAAGRRTGAADVSECFNCHATHSVKGTQLTLDRMTAGVQCERCHGESSAHLEAVRTGSAKAATPRRLGQLSTEEVSDFCGQCHRTWADIAMKGPHSILNVRFQPYRLALSKCYSADDKRISCTTCHDPHSQVQRSAAAYDTKCLSCHAASASPATKASAHLCKVAKKDCVTCHMPKLELPGSHNKFADHMIRIARANEKYPD
jgi:hypothetical protein